MARAPKPPDESDEPADAEAEASAPKAAKARKAPRRPAAMKPRRAVAKRRRSAPKRARTRWKKTTANLKRAGRWLVRSARAVDRSHYRRFIVSFVAGLVVLGAMRVDTINRSMFGDPDRAMMEMAFKIRADQETSGDPVSLIDIDDATIAAINPETKGQIRAPLATAPRGVVADVLEYIRTAPPGRGARGVIVDVDFATPTPGDEAGAAKLHDVLMAWAHTPSAPKLMLARQSFPRVVFTGNDQDTQLVLPSTAYDDIVGNAQNINWVNVKMMGDQNGVIREFLPYECVIGPGNQPTILYSAVLMAYGELLEDINTLPGTNAGKWIFGAQKDCANPHRTPIIHGELINYHLSLGKGENGRVWHELPKTWPGFKKCGAVADTSVFRRLSAGDVAQAGPDASHDIICGRLLILGGTNLIASDFQQTPLNEMAGPVIIANSVRGLQMSRGGLQRVPTWLQLSVLLVMSAAITLGFTITRRIRENYLDLKTRHRDRPLLVRLRLLPFNPVVLNWAFAIGAHWVGIGLLLISLDQGYWGYLSAPAFASAAVGAMQEFADDED